MDIVLMNNSSDADTINKALNPVRTLTGSLKNNCSIETPTVIINNSGMINANYAYIPEFGRYYYITDQIILSNERVSISMKVDVLESFKSDILSLSAIVEQSTSNYDKYMSDEIWLAKVKKSTTIINFSSGLLDTGQFILITAGG